MKQKEKDAVRKDPEERGWEKRRHAGERGRRDKCRGKKGIMKIRMQEKEEEEERNMQK